MERLARLGHNDGIFKAHKQRERLPGVIWHVSNVEEPEFGVKMGRGQLVWNSSKVEIGF